MPPQDPICLQGSCNLHPLQKDIISQFRSDQLQRQIQRQETVDAIRTNEREKLRINEALMGLLLRLDSVPGFNPTVREARREGITIKAVLLHAEELSSENRQVKEWLSMLKDAFYDADDLLDELSLKALQKQVMTGTRMAKEAIGERLDEIAENRKFFLEERHEERRIAANKGRDQTHSFHLKLCEVIGSSQCLIDVGLEYFGDLLWRSFFQEVEKDDLGNYTTCKMHDLMHDLAMSVVGEECTSSNFEVGYTNEKTRHISFKIDRLSHAKVISPSMLKANKVRTFLLLRSSTYWDYEEETPQIKELCSAMSALSCLRVLDLHQLRIMSVPRSVEKLKHLRGDGQPYRITNFAHMECPQLEAKCEKNVGEDWPKVAHIPNIDINGEEIQRNL
ncbi:hypothetical protein GH714_026781 [Hevea brasiliensis]|uniref:BAG domain-containing protein n=1 Tax=Hevea brasiliensis TaxID=3981 RepID=A0A6A6N278_HEVBR|nr:hypothetical protein GH714_026781 [Hevea brasiliensis]